MMLELSKEMSRAMRGVEITGIDMMRVVHHNKMVKMQEKGD